MADDVEEPLLRPPLVGDVERDPDGARDGAPGVAQRLDVRGEGAPVPLHLEVHGLAHQGAAVGGDRHELGVVRREVLEEAPARVLVRREAEPLEAGAEARGESQLGVGRPHDGRHLLGEQTEVRLAAALLAPRALGTPAVVRIVPGQRKGNGRLHAAPPRDPLAPFSIPSPRKDPGLDRGRGPTRDARRA